MITPSDANINQETTKKPEPLGYVEIATGSIPIQAMRDTFLNYTFNDTSNWETLRLTINIMIERYHIVKPTTPIKPIEGDIVVETQWEHIKGLKESKFQDFKVNSQWEPAISKKPDESQTVKLESKRLTFVEFQNRARPLVPVDIRALEYLGLAISHGPHKQIDQLWLMAKDLPEVMFNNIFSNFMLVDEVSNNRYTKFSGIMFCSLSKLANEDSKASELAQFLLGLRTTSKYPEVMQIIQAFNNAFKAFKNDREVHNMLTREEELRMIWEREGEIKGKIEIYYRVLKFTPSQIASELNIPELEVTKILAENGFMPNKAL
jgi:hypothetical protein